MDASGPAEETGEEECPSSSYLEERDELLGLVTDALSGTGGDSRVGQADEFDRFSNHTLQKFARIVSSAARNVQPP